MTSGLLAALFAAFSALLALVCSAYFIKYRKLKDHLEQLTTQHTQNTQNNQTNNNTNTNTTTPPQQPTQSNPNNQAKYMQRKTSEHSELSDVLKDVLNQLTRGRGVAYVDIQNKTLLGVETAEPFPEAVIQLIVAATMDLFTAPNIIKVSNLYKMQKGQASDYCNFHEMMVYGDDATYIFIRAQSNVNRICIFAFNNQEDNNTVGILLHQARLFMPKIEVAAEAAFLSE